MKIPIIEGQRQQLRPRTEDNQALDVRGSAGGFLAQGLEQAGGAVAGLGPGIEKAIQRANNTAVVGALNEWEDSANTAMHGKAEGDGNVTATPGATPGLGLDLSEPQRGFLSSKGMEAVAQSGPVLQQLEKERQRIASKLTNEEQRAAFLEHSAQAFTARRAQVESHASQQIQVAQQSAVKGAVETSLTAIANNFADPAFTAEQSQRAETAIRSLQLSPEDGDAKVAAYRSDVATVRLNQYLAAKDWRGASGLFAVVKEQLAPERQSHFEQLIGGVRFDQEAERTASGIVATAPVSHGQLDIAAIDKGIDDVPAGPLRDEVRRRVGTRVAEVHQELEAQKRDVSNRAFSLYNVKGWSGMDAATKQQLNDVNPELYDRLKDDAERKWRTRKTSDAEARREQRDANQAARLDFLSRPVDERSSLDIASTYGGTGVDNLGLKQLAVDQRHAKDSVDKGQASSEQEFMRQAMAAGQGLVTTKDAQARFKAEAALEYQRFVDEKKRAPTLEEANRAIGGLLTTVQVPGRFWGTNDVPEFQRRAAERKATAGKPAAPGAAPASTTAPAQRRKVPVTNGSQRGQVYEDQLGGWLAKNPGWRAE